MAPGAPASTPTAFLPEGPFLDLLAVSLAGVNVLQPVYEATGELVDFAIEYLNPAGQRMTGLAERPGGTLLTRFPHAIAAGIFAYYQRVYQAGATDVHEVNYQADGLDNFFRLAARRSGEWLVVSFTDTSDQDRSAVEEALRESQAAEQAAHAVAEQQRHRFREVLTQMPAYIAVYQGPDHIYQFVNPAYQSLFPHRSFLGRPFREGTPESVELGVVALFDQVYQTGEPVYLREMEGWFDFHGNGQPVQVFLNISLHPLRDVQGQLDGVLDFTYDVSEQVHARRQLEQFNQELETRVQARTQEVEAIRAATERQRRQWEELFRMAPAAICILQGPELVYEFLNPIYQQFFPDRQLLGKPLRDALPELADHAAYYTMRHVFDSGETVWQQALHVPLARTEDGVLEDRYFNYIQQPRYDEQGRIDGVLVFGFEVTELVETRQQVERLNQQLAAINAELTATNQELGTSNAQLTRTNVELDTFVYTASHDLKAPITNIEGILLALRDTLPAAVRQDEVVAHLLELLDNTVTRFQFTIDQLTDISRLQLAHVGPAEPVPLAPVVEAVRLDLAPALAAAGTDLTVAVAPELVVPFSLANLRSIVYNLFSNAVKYRAADRPSRVQLRAEQLPHAIRLTVQDNGLGMSEVQQRQLFGLFQRLHTHVEGTGVGLYITKRMIENAGGTIQVQSQPDAGTTFTVTFPT
jgi:signal transduction histidine kinase